MRHGLTIPTGSRSPPASRRSSRGSMTTHPNPGEGFEAAVAYAVAGEMGFTDDQVTWVRTTFDEAIQPGAKNFDFNLQQYSITPERAEIDLVLRPVLLEQPGDRRPRGLAGRGRHLGGRPEGRQVRRPGRARPACGFITDVIQPDAEPFVYDDNVGAKAALEADQIDAIVVDLPTALFIWPSRSRAAASSASSPPRPAAPPTTSGWCSRRTTRSSSAPTPRWPR